MRAWNGGYHCTGSTYGTWLRGDPRGWRSSKHHVHVDGDYKKRPPTGGIWAKKCKARPIKDREHQLNVASYIPKHAKKGAFVIFLPKAKPGASAPGRP